MNKVRGVIADVYHMATVIGLFFVTWKIVRRWHRGLAERTGHTIDVSVSVAAEKLEKAAVALENWADNGQGKTLGKSLDGVLMDTKDALDKATDLVQHVFDHGD